MKPAFVSPVTDKPGFVAVHVELRYRPNNSASDRQKGTSCHGRRIASIGLPALPESHTPGSISAWQVQHAA